MFSVLLVLLIIVAVFMTGLILLQKSEGSGMSGSAAASMFGGALTGAAAGNFLTKLTAWMAVIFFVLCAALALVSSKTAKMSAESELRQELVQTDAPVEPQSTPIPAETEQVTVDTNNVETQKVETKKVKSKKK